MEEHLASPSSLRVEEAIEGLIALSKWDQSASAHIVNLVEAAKEASGKVPQVPEEAVQGNGDKQQAEQQQEAQQQQGVQQEPVKRKRGRPKKQPQDQVVPNGQGQSTADTAGTCLTGVP
jgi:hypothetical protein